MDALHGLLVQTAVSLRPSDLLGHYQDGLFPHKYDGKTNHKFPTNDARNPVNFMIHP